MKAIGSFEAKTHFSKLLAEVGRGKKLLITKNGKPVAMLIPVEMPAELSVEEALERLQKIRQKRSGRKITVDEINAMKEKGRK